MSQTETIKGQLAQKFGFGDDVLKMQRQRRLWVDLTPTNFSRVIEYAVKELKFAILCTITGLDDGDSFRLIYHLATMDGEVLNLNYKFLKTEKVVTITDIFPNAAIYEREVIDLFGIQVEGLPPGMRYPLPDDWPSGQYPLRKDWNVAMLKEADKGSADKTSKTKLEARNIEVPIGPKEQPLKGPTSFSMITVAEEGSLTVPIGPQHPSLKEPESFSVALRGEKITGLGIRIGYNHRGIEKACELNSFVQDVYLTERICGICSHAHSTCFVQAVEEIAGLQVPKRGLYIRTLIAELERIHSHLLWLGVAGHEVGFDTLLMYSWRDREAVMDILTTLTGNRVNYGLNTIGGVRRDINADQIAEVLKVVDKLIDQTKYYIQVGTEETTLIQRLSGVGKLSKEDVLKLGAVGPTGRASGIGRDARKDDPYAAYGELDFKVITDNHGDVYGRTLVRLGELMESYSMIKQLLKNLPDGPIAVKAPRKIPPGEAFSRYEAPRGEDVHYVKTNGTENPERVKVRAPTLANIQAVSKMLEDRYLADMPIVIAAIDPCFSCTDRTIAVADKLLTWEELRQYGIDWYKKQGVDFSKVKRLKKVD